MSALGSTLFKWFPASLIVSLFGLGYTFWCREVWLAIFAALTVLVSGYFATPFIAPINPDMIDYGTALIRVAAVLFFVGWFSLAVYEADKGGAEYVVFDYFWGMFLTFILVVPALTYAAKFFDGIINYLCFAFVNCFDTLHFISYLAALAIPSLIYIYIGVWEFWPIAMIKRELKSSFRNFFIEFVKVAYTVTIFSLIVFFFMHGNIMIMFDYIIEVFSRLIPGGWLPVIYI